MPNLSVSIDTDTAFYTILNSQYIPSLYPLPFKNLRKSTISSSAT